MQQSRLVFLGFGYVAKALAAKLNTDLWQVSAIVRARRAHEERHYTYVQFINWPTGNVTQDVADTLSTATHIVSSVPPGKTGDAAMQVLSSLVATGATQLEWLALLATTGPYGDRKGAWVDETAKISPDHIRASLRASQEIEWMELFTRNELPVHIFRLSGIYGPGRSALDKLRNSNARRIVKTGQVFNRIHVDDIVQVLLASMASPDPGAIYNVADDKPAPPQDVVAFAASLLGVVPPACEPFETADLTSMARSFYADNRRVCNKRIKIELGIKLKYPDYKFGLKAIFADGG